LVVRPSSVIARYQGQQRDPREIGQELGVSAVLTAGYIHSGERFRVTAQLIDVGSGELLWSDRIDTAASDIIVLQDTIAQRIVEGLRVELSPAEQVGIAKAATQNPAAYEHYLRGRDLFARFIFRTLSEDDCDGAIEHFEHAIQLDPNFALAHDGLGACHVNRVFKGFGGAEDYERAEKAFTKALSIDPNLFEARMLMVFVYLWRGQKQKARDEVSRARREAPNEPVVHFVKALLHRLDGVTSDWCAWIRRRTLWRVTAVPWFTCTWASLTKRFGSSTQPGIRTMPSCELSARLRCTTPGKLMRRRS
jgi:serine/threonine-protein kinase